MATRAAQKVIYHKELGPSPPMYLVDARMAVKLHPNEWSDTPWEKKTEKVAAMPAVKIPDEWRAMNAYERIALAADLGAKRFGLSAAKADEWIEAELAKRVHA